MGAEVEHELAGLIRAKLLDRAATRALESYGPELWCCASTADGRGRRSRLKDELRERGREAVLVGNES